MLSASHNPMPDNGIKFFARGGNKLDDELENAIESRMGESWARPTGAGVGRVTVDEHRVEDYISHLVNSLGRPVSLEGLKVVVDCANGAGYVAAPAAFEAQGAEVVRIHATPDGLNINENCGSTHMDSLRSTVLAEHADIGIALDGDADRCLAVDAAGPDRRRGSDPGHPGAGHARGGRAEERHGGGHRDEQPRVRPGDAGRRADRRADPGGGPLRAGGDARRGILPGR